MIVLLILVFLLVVGLWYFKMYKNVGKKPQNKLCLWSKQTLHLYQKTP